MHSSIPKSWAGVGWAGWKLVLSLHKSFTTFYCQKKLVSPSFSFSLVGNVFNVCCVLDRAGPLILTMERG